MVIPNLIVESARSTNCSWHGFGGRRQGAGYTLLLKPLRKYYRLIGSSRLYSRSTHRPTKCTQYDRLRLGTVGRTWRSKQNLFMGAVSILLDRRNTKACIDKFHASEELRNSCLMSISVGAVMQKPRRGMVEGLAFSHPQARCITRCSLTFRSPAAHVQVLVGHLHQPFAPPEGSCGVVYTKRVSTQPTIISKLHSPE